MNWNAVVAQLEKEAECSQYSDLLLSIARSLRYGIEVAELAVAKERMAERQEPRM